ncbi:MAG: polysaccharide deacetylase family protein [Gammaproteobacteria bacterium]
MPDRIGHPSRQGATPAARGARTRRRRQLRVSAAAVSAALVCAVGAASAADAGAGCKGTVYLTLDTGNMSRAQFVADILRRHEVKATFFLANERTDRGDFALDDEWSGYWRARAAEGHAFGSHTYDHVYLREARTAGRAAARAGAGDPAARDSAGALPVFLARPQFGTNAGRTLTWDGAALCSELRRVDARLRELAGRGLDPLWRAPGGRAPAAAMQAASGCGFRHVHWAPAGFLGDELPSETHPNERLLEQALARVRDGDVLMAHLGIWSRREPFAPMLDPLIAGLKRRGLCFATLGAPAVRGRP